MNGLLTTTSHHSDSVKNVVTGSTIIFFDDEDEISASPSSTLDNYSTKKPDKIENLENTSNLALEEIGSEPNDATSHPNEHESNYSEVRYLTII